MLTLSVVRSRILVIRAAASSAFLGLAQLALAVRQRIGHGVEGVADAGALSVFLANRHAAAIVAKAPQARSVDRLAAWGMDGPAGAQPGQEQRGAEKGLISTAFSQLWVNIPRTETRQAALPHDPG